MAVEHREALTASGMSQELADLLRCPRSGGRLRLESFESDRRAVLTGLLHGDAITYPVIAGIPVFTGDVDRLVRVVRAGNGDEAAARAAFGHLPVSRLPQLADLLATTRLTRPLARAVGRLADRSRTRLGAAALFGERGGPPDPLAPLRLGYLGTYPSSPEAYRYFSYRLSMPRHLVALSVIEWAERADAPVLDLGCGAGHMTAALQARMSPQLTVGLNTTFFELWIAKHHLAPGAEFVCADASAMPFGDGVFRLSFASDVLSFVVDKASVAREMRRVVTADGVIAITSVKNSLQQHTYAGLPLSPDGWRGLAGDLPHRLLPDSAILAAYLAGAGLPLGTQPPEDQVEACRAVTLVATRDPRLLVDGAPLTDWPHARGPLTVNPLYAVVGHSADTTDYELRFPSPTYAADNAEMAGYLPHRLSVRDVDAAAALRGEVTPALAEAVAQTAVLAAPEWLRRACGR